MKKKQDPKDRTYLLKSGGAPVSHFIQSRHTHRSPLLHFDEEKNENRALRYARNQKSIFIDEQDGNAILEQIVVSDGVLMVQRTNPILQEFLYFHPGNVINGGNEFYELDLEKEAQQNVEELFDEVDALIAARELDLNTMMAIGRVYLNGNVDKMSSNELKRDILLFAKNYPKDFIQAVNDPDLATSNIAARAISEGYVSFRGNKDLFYNLKDNKKKILTVPFGEKADDALMAWLHSEAGNEFYNYLTKEFEE